MSGRRLGLFVFVPFLIALGGCVGAYVGGISGVLVAGRSPTNEIEQVYYLGIFDPQGQLQPSIYRVRVHGQASILSTTRFASGWVPADLIDSLGTGPKFNETDVLEIKESEKLAKLRTGRRLMTFGPEGFRESPADHRLVIVMGSDPSAFFEAIDSALGQISKTKADQDTSRLKSQLFQAMAQMRTQRQALERLEDRLPKDAKP